MFKIIAFLTALNGQPITSVNDCQLTVMVEDGHNVVTFTSPTVTYMASDCQFTVKDGNILISKRTGKPFIQITKEGIQLPNIQ